MTKKKPTRPNSKTGKKRYVMELSVEEMRKLETDMWERQDGETQIAFNLFSKYLHMPRRKVRELALEHGVTEHDMYYYSSTYRWKERSRAYDNYIERRKVEVHLREIEEMASRHAKQALAMESALMYPVREYIEKLKSIDMNDIKSMSAKELYQFVLAAADKLPKIIDIERKARGVPTELNASAIDVTSNGEVIQPSINILVKGSQSPLLTKLDNEENG